MKVIAQRKSLLIRIPLTRVDTPYFTGNVDAWYLENPLYSLITGNIPGARDPKNPDKGWISNQANAVVTRYQFRNKGMESEPHFVHEITDVSPDDIDAAQEEDETLVKIRTMVGQDDDNSKVSYIYS